MSQEEEYLPLGDRVMVKPFSSDEKSEGGIIIPETARENTQKGTVVAAGVNTTVKIGDVVLYGKQMGTDIPGGLKMFNEPQLFAVIKNKK